jgi:WD40 repeat protein
MSLHFASRLLAAACAALFFNTVSRQWASAVQPPAVTVKGAEPRTDRYGDGLPEGTVARMGSVRLRSLSYRATGAFSPDGKVLAVCASGAFGGAIVLWAVPSGKELRRFPGPRSWGGEAAFSPDGKLLAVADDRVVAFLEPATGKERLRLPRHAEELVCFAFSPDGRRVATAGGDRVAGKDYAIHLWDVATGRELARLNGHRTCVSQVTFSADGRQLISCSQDLHLISPKGRRDTAGSIRVWDLATGRLRKAIPTTDCDVAVAPGGGAVAFREPGGGFDLRRLGVGKTVAKLEAGTPVYIRYSPRGAVLALWDNNQVIQVVDTGTGRCLRRLDRLAAHVPLCLSDQGKLLATVAYSEERPGWAVRLWDVATGAELGPGRKQPDAVACLAFTSDGRVLATGGTDGSLRAWQALTGKELWHCQAHRGLVQCVAFSAAGNLVVSTGEDDKLRLWDAATGRALRPPQKLPCNAVSLGVSPDGKSLLVACADGKAYVFAGDRCTPLRDFTALGKDKQFGYFALSPGGRNWALAEWEVKDYKMVRALHLRDGHASREFNLIPPQDVGGEVDHAVNALAFSGDGRFLTSLDARMNHEGAWVAHRIRLWETATGKEVLHLAPRRDVRSVAISSDSRILAATSASTPATPPAVYLWDLATGQELRPLRGHLGIVNCVAFSSDGQWLASGADDGTALVWHVRRPAMKDRRPAGPRAPLELLWRDLAGADAARAYRAAWELAAAPQEALPFLHQRLHPVRAPDPKYLARLIAQLDSPSYPVREAATTQLYKLGELAEPALRRALAPKLPLEVRRRLEHLLSKFGQEPTPDQRRAVRVTGVLERIGSVEARRLLESLAKGVPEDRLTREAQATLERLARPGARRLDAKAGPRAVR